MSGYWRVWCPICRDSRQTRIPYRGEVPDVAEASAVRAEYGAHLQRQHREREVAS